MKKEEFQALTIEQQVNYINERMQQGETLTNACKQIGITKEVSRKFQRNGYSLVDMQFILPNQPPQAKEIAIDAIIPPKPKSVKKVQETKKIGRPCKTQATTKLTLEISKQVAKDLKHHCIDLEIPMNKFIEELLIKNLK